LLDFFLSRMDRDASSLAPGFGLSANLFLILSIYLELSFPRVLEGFNDPVGGHETEKPIGRAKINSKRMSLYDHDLKTNH